MMTLDKLKWEYVVHCGKVTLEGEIPMDPGEWLYENHISLGWDVSEELAKAFMGIWLHGEQLDHFVGGMYGA